MLYAPKEKGQGLTEYVLIISLIAILLMLALGWITGSLDVMYSRISSAIRAIT